MLNELYVVGKSLSNAHIQLQDWHSAYKPIPKIAKGTSGNSAFFVFINQDGSIARVERITDPSEAEGLRKWEPSNGFSFPYFNIPPLWWIDFKPDGKDKIQDDESFKRKLDKQALTREELELFIDSKTESAKKWEANQLKRLTSCIQKLPEQLELLLGTPNEEVESVSSLIQRVMKTDGSQFYESLKLVIKRQIFENPQSARLYFSSLFHYGDKKPINSVSILLELADAGSNFQYPVKSPKIGEWINSRLIANQNSMNVDATVTDAFGLSVTGSDETFPSSLSD